LTIANAEGDVEDQLVKKNNMKEIKPKIEWLSSSHAYGSACVRITHGKVIYIDPSHLSSEHSRVKADLILVTHSHDDHLSIKALQDLSRESTTIVTPKDCYNELIQAIPEFTLKALSPGDKTTVEDISIEAVAAYNIESSAHPKSKDWLGFIVTIGGVRIYHSGDTSYIPEMKDLNDIDIAIVTVRDRYMMNGKQVVEAIASFMPKIVISVHWLPPEESDIRYIQEHAPSGIEVLILDPLN
jgi:L-ascorbate metabolism protein UlaG (beta-lactamase superfamily)